MKQGLEVALKPMANTVFDGLNKFMPTLQKLMEQITPVISDAVNAAMPFVDDFLTGAAAAIESVAPMVTDLASRLFPVLTELMSTLLPPILDLVNALFPAAMQITAEILAVGEGFSTREQSTIRLNGGKWDANVEQITRENEKLSQAGEDPGRTAQQVTSPSKPKRPESPASPDGKTCPSLVCARR